MLPVCFVTQIGHYVLQTPLHGILIRNRCQ